MRTLLTQEEISALAGHYFIRIETIIRGAFQDYLNCLTSITATGIRTNFMARTSGSLIHDLIKSRVKQEFHVDPNVRADEFNGIFGLLISKKIFIRFKKLNFDMKASNVETEQVVLFKRQQLELEGLGRPTMLTAGYIPDVTWTAIENIFLTCQQNDTVIWHKNLKTESNQSSIFSESSETKENQQTTTPLVRLKSKQTGDTLTGT
jgi:hypothetical protein